MTTAVESPVKRIGCSDDAGRVVGISSCWRIRIVGGRARSNANEATAIGEICDGGNQLKTDVNEFRQIVFGIVPTACGGNGQVGVAVNNGLCR